jgi:hypothetical protein
MRKIVNVSGLKDYSCRTPDNCYSMWTFCIDIETDNYEFLTHDELYDLLGPFIKNSWPNIDVNCGATCGASPMKSNGMHPQSKDFYLYFKTSEDEAEFILENKRLVGVEV